MAAPRQERAQAATVTPPPPRENISRARAIFSVADEEKPINPADFDFALAEDAAAVKALPQPRGAGAASRTKRGSRRILGMSIKQIALLAGLGIALLCILAAFGYLLFGVS